MKINLGFEKRKKERLFPAEFYHKALPVSLVGRDILLVKALADVFSNSPCLEDHHLIGAAGQVMVAKALGLRLNGFFYEVGDGGIDYKGTRIDTKTVYSPHEEPILWIPQDPRKRKGPKIFIGANLKAINRGSIQGEIFGFAPTSLINSMDVEKFVESKFEKLGIREKFLYPISWLLLALNCSQDFKKVMGQFFPPDVLNEVHQCLPNTHAHCREDFLGLLPFQPEVEGAGQNSWL